MKWTNSQQVIAYTEWYKTFFTQLKVKHEIANEFVLKLYDFYLYDRNVFDFFITELLKAEFNNIKVIIIHQPFISLSKNIKCSGYFDHVNRELACSTNTPIQHWLGIFTHESCQIGRAHV